jgi:hypothetical protein
MKCFFFVGRDGVASNGTLTFFFFLLSRHAKIYIRALELLKTKPEYLTTETERLTRMIESGSLSAAKVDEFVARLNILAAFH